MSDKTQNILGVSVYCFLEIPSYAYTIDEYYSHLTAKKPKITRFKLNSNFDNET